MNRRHKVLIIICVGFALLAISLWILTSRWMENGQKPIGDGSHAYAIVLGAKVNGTVPSLSLHYRLEAAYEYASHYPHVKLVLAGGQGPGENVSEAEAMKTFLMANGIEENRLILEGNSTSTYENIVYAKELLPPSITAVTIITSDYHLSRARRIAQQVNLETDAVAAKTPEIVKTKLTLRERVALIKTAIAGP